MNLPTRHLDPERRDTPRRKRPDIRTNHGDALGACSGHKCYVTLLDSTAIRVGSFRSLPLMLLPVCILAVIVTGCTDPKATKAVRVAPAEQEASKAATGTKALTLTEANRMEVKKAVAESSLSDADKRLFATILERDKQADMARKLGAEIEPVVGKTVGQILNEAERLKGDLDPWMMAEAVRVAQEKQEASKPAAGQANRITPTPAPSGRR